MRCDEDMTSDRMYEITAGSLCEILGQAGRRLNVRDLQTGEVGWISSATKSGARLVQPATQDQLRQLAFSDDDAARDIDEV